MSPTINPSTIAKLLGKRGGDTTKARGKDYYRRLQRQSVAARKRNQMIRGRSATIQNT